MATLCDLSDANTTVLISYEERTTGNKPLLEKKFQQVKTAMIVKSGNVGPFSWDNW